METENKSDSLAQQRRNQILAAAKYIFARNGYRRTKIEQIAVRLNIGKGTIYRYFDGKQTLFLAVFEQGMTQLSLHFADNVHPITDPKQRIAAAVRTYFGFFENNRELIEILMQVRSEFKDEYKRVFLAMYNDYIVRIQDNLRKGVEIGVFHQMDIEKTAEAISASLQGVLQSFYVREFGIETTTQNPQKQALTDRIDAVTALLLNGVLKKG